MSLVIESGTFAYPKAPPILQDVSLSVAPGELLAILGPNGAGKTTLLRCMIGLQPWTTGTSTLDGDDIRGLTPAALWRRVAYVPQARSAASLSLTGLDMVTIGRSAHLPLLAQPGERERELATHVMTDIGIGHLAAVPCGQMSGGQLQMVLIARALVAEPTVLVLDEPETGLDFRNQLIVLDLLDNLVHQNGISVVMNTHYPSHALRIADRSILLRPGHPQIHGATAKVITADTMNTMFDVDVHISSVTISGRRHDAVLPLAVAQASLPPIATDTLLPQPIGKHHD